MNLASGLHNLAAMMVIPLDRLLDPKDYGTQSSKIYHVSSNVLFNCIKTLSRRCKTGGATCCAYMVTASNRR
ncbi:hypothetical protein EUGRSUZ_H03721 [Eucalyptus grandis]|uniref:Uncharacterized protein n=2 Tax=Eucalyptus grandis TaxID=71139 RepID=A0ACC3JUI9_EUCGR|nr:hypothetical protein EUGRSUZ_H03721 [Eucalyptus grandis]